MTKKVYIVGDCCDAHSVHQTYDGAVRATVKLAKAKAKEVIEHMSPATRGDFLDIEEIQRYYNIQEIELKE